MLLSFNIQLFLFFVFLIKILSYLSEFKSCCVHRFLRMKSLFSLKPIYDKIVKTALTYKLFLFEKNKYFAHFPL